MKWLIHYLGLCRKARAGYTCYGRSIKGEKYAECK